jgi:hypothetical protein
MLANLIHVILGLPTQVSIIPNIFEIKIIERHQQVCFILKSTRSPTSNTAIGKSLQLFRIAFIKTSILNLISEWMTNRLQQAVPNLPNDLSFYALQE